MKEITALNLTEKEGRWILLTALLRAAICNSDGPEEAEAVDDMMDELESLFNEEEKEQLQSKIDRLHETVGCSSFCQHKKS